MAFLSNTQLFHHIGYATVSIDRELPNFVSLGYCVEGERFSDPIQGISGLFLTGPGPRIELLENLPGAITLSPWLEKGVRMYHMAWEVDDLDGTVEEIRSQRGRIMVEPVVSVAFTGRRIAFALLRNGLLIELIGV